MFIIAHKGYKVDDSFIATKCLKRGCSLMRSSLPFHFLLSFTFLRLYHAVSSKFLSFPQHFLRSVCWPVASLSVLRRETFWRVCSDFLSFSRFSYQTMELLPLKSAYALQLFLSHTHACTQVRQKKWKKPVWTDGNKLLPAANNMPATPVTHQTAVVGVTRRSHAIIEYGTQWVHTCCTLTALTCR